MNKEKTIKRIAIIGAGPSALFVCNYFINSIHTNFEIHVFEKTNTLGAGMPYSKLGANSEHIANVSANEIPQLITTVKEWVRIASPELLQRFHINPLDFNEYEVLPRLFLGEYLSAQFQLLLEIAHKKSIPVYVHLNHTVVDISDKPDKSEVLIETDRSGIQSFDTCIICTGHYWPEKEEGKIPGYYNSPYPPSKLLFKADHPVAIRGSSLTAIDVIRTMSRTHGNFSETSNGHITYTISDENKNFRIVLHSSNGMLPAIRIHFEEPQAANHNPLTPEIVAQNRMQNNGFLSLDFVFDIAFKKPLEDSDPAFYERIQHMNMETFVHTMMHSRELQDPFILFEKEYYEAQKSIHHQVPIYWKEMLAALSFAMNYPAKYFSAEDMKRLQDTLSEIISIVIAFIPQSSARVLLALHAAGILDIIDVDAKSYVEPIKSGGIQYHYSDEHHSSASVFYHTYIDAVGQKKLSLEDFPFKTLFKENTISQARLKFQDSKAGEKELAEGNKKIEKDPDGFYYLKVSGIKINDNFQIVNNAGIANKRIYIMAVPYISGYNPDYSGLDFCDKASQLISKHFFSEKDQ